MKSSFVKLAVLFLFTLSFSAQAGNSVSALDTVDLQVLKSVADMKFSGYSKANKAGAKVFQMVYGDGGYNSSTAIVVIEGDGGFQGFPVANSISGITRITFSGVGELTVNYTRSKPIGDTEVIEENHSVKFKFSKKADGSYADSISIVD